MVSFESVGAEAARRGAVAAIVIEPPTRCPLNNRLERLAERGSGGPSNLYALRLRPQLICDPFPLALRLELISPSI